MMSAPEHFAATTPTPGAIAPGHSQTETMDCETAMLYRAWLRPLFETAPSWDRLVAELQAKGYALAIRDGRLFLTRRDTGRRFCSARFLGTSLRELSARLGRPMIRARRDRRAAGDFMYGAAPAH